MFERFAAQSLEALAIRTGFIAAQRSRRTKFGQTWFGDTWFAAAGRLAIHLFREGVGNEPFHESHVVQRSRQQAVLGIALVELVYGRSEMFERALVAAFPARDASVS